MPTVEAIHKRITMSNPQEFVELITRKASSNPLRKKLHLFIESVAFMAAGGWKGMEVRMQNTLQPGLARLGGAEEYSFGYQWQCIAILPKKEMEPTSASCFLTMNERGLFDRLYGNNPDADPELLYADFMPAPDASDYTNKDTHGSAQLDDGSN